MGKETRHTATLTRKALLSSLEALIEESRSLRRQMADDLSNEVRKVRRMSRHFARTHRSSE